MKRAIIISAVLIIIAISIPAGIKLYRVFFGLNVSREEPGYVLFIPTGSTYDNVIDILLQDKVLKDIGGFEWLAKRLDYPASVHPGRYELTKGMTNRQIINKLRSGSQDAVKIFFKKYRTKAAIAGFISKKLEVDSAQLMILLNDSIYLLKDSLNPENAISIFISDQYEFYWNTSAEQLIRKMVGEFENFWSDGRIEKAEEQNLTPLEVITLASIVEEETNNADEKPRIAGVYLNRLEKGMKLQADPTVKFALQQFELRRVTIKQTRFESPYNTYHIEGLPPGPICIPSKQSIEAVLNPESHDYLFFCAKGDGSGTHLFAETYKQHVANARKYRKLLDLNNIF